MKVNKPGAFDFADYIKKLPPQWVIEHFLRDFDISRKILSSSMIDNAVKSFGSAENLRHHFQSLPFDIQFRCAQVYLYGDKGVTLKKANPFDDPLIMSFLTYAAYDNNRNVCVFGFDQFERHLRPLFIEVLLQSASASITVPAEIFEFRVLNDLTTIAALCLQGAVVKKKRGGIGKTTSVLFKKLIDNGSISRAEENDYVYSFAIGYLLHKKILFETESQYKLLLPAFLSWLSEDKNSRLKELEIFCFEYAGGWHRELFLNMIRENNTNWISTSIFTGLELKDAINMLHVLRFCGLLELKSKDSEIIFSKSRKISRSKSEQKLEIVVLPDFTAMIPNEIEASELFQFAQIGTLQSLDRVYWGKIDKSVILDTCTRGVDAAQIMQWLGGWQAPVNVMETVREWLREYLRLYITDQNLVISNDEKVTMQINSFEPIRSYLEPVFAHAFFKIKKGNELKVKEILQSMGFDYRMPGQEISGEPGQLNAEESPFVSVSWTPVTEIERPAEEQVIAMRGTKYGSGLKKLDTSEIVHVIDYAILTGGTICFEYEGSPYLKQGFYTVKPLSFQKGIEPAFEGEITRSKSKKMFYLKKIIKIGVA